MTNIMGVVLAVPMCAALALSAAPDMPARILDTYGKLPIQFEANHGQAASPVRYVARGAGYRVALAPQEAQWTLSGGGPVRMRVMGANRDADIEGLNLQPGHVNYLLGSDTAKWATRIPVYSRVRYRSIYPGVDLVFYGKQREFEYDFVVAAGADASRIAIQFDAPITMDRGGALRIKAGSEELIQHPPVAYQTRADGSRSPVNASYQLAKGGAVRFRIGKYDRSLPLVIDPVLTYATYLGGAGSDAAASVAVDSQGQAVIVGGTTSSNFPTSGPIQSTFGGTNQSNPNRRLGDVFVAKLNASGTALIFSTYLGGSRDEAATAVSLDNEGNIYLAGITDSTNFPATSNAFQRAYGGGGSNPLFQSGDAFVAKLNPTGTAILYASYLGGSADDVAYGIAVDRDGNAYIGGNTQSSNFPTVAPLQSTLTQSTQGPTSWIAGDGFVAKVNTAGTALQYSTFLGGGGDDMVRAIAVDTTGAAFVTGHTTSSNFPVTGGAFQRTSRDSSERNFGEVFVAKLNADGRALAYSTFLGGSQSDTGHGIAVDASGSAYVVGTTSSANFPVTNGAFRATAPGATGQSGDNTRRIFIGADAFVAKVNAAGSELVYSTFIGGSAEEAATAVAVDSAGMTYVTGSTLSANFPLSTDALFNTYRGSGVARTAVGDAFVLKLNATGTAMPFATLMGGSDDDGGADIALDSGGNIYVAGASASNNFPTTTGAFRTTYTGTVGYPNGDGFVAKISSESVAVPARLRIVSGGGQTGAVGARLAQPLIIEVQDAQGRGVPGVAVTFTGTNATVAAASATTDAAGQASTTVTLGATVGSASVSAAAAGLTPVRFDLTATATTTDPIAKVNAIVKNGSYTPNGAPGVIVSIFGENLAPTTVAADALPFPTSLGNVRVILNGTPIPLIYVSPTQINAQLPYETPLGTVQLIVEARGQTATGTITVLAASPGILYYGDNRAVVVNPTGEVNGTTTPAPAGSIVTFYLVGQGRLDNPVANGAGAPVDPLSRPILPASITIGGQTAEALFIGMTPGSVGLLQANVRVPASLASGDYPVVLRIGEESSNTALIAVSARQ
ncbi:MAG TPA: SBBP repeat-containing protein [Bryobacteraceae bacterium]|nr:SBBP repeat-containing protein [Bryobacteraceae bacterium]